MSNGCLYSPTAPAVISVMIHISGGSKEGRQGRAPPPRRQNSFIFMQFSTKKLGSRSHFGSWRPPPPDPPLHINIGKNISTNSQSIMETKWYKHSKLCSVGLNFKTETKQYQLGLLGSTLSKSGVMLLTTDVAMVLSGSVHFRSKRHCSIKILFQKLTKRIQTWSTFKNAYLFKVHLKRSWFWSTNHRPHQLHVGISLTLVYSSTNMSKSVWTSGFWKPLVHKTCQIFGTIYSKISLKTLPKKQEIAF